jgi:hypothetical protein
MSLKASHVSIDIGFVIPVHGAVVDVVVVVVNVVIVVVSCRVVELVVSETLVLIAEVVVSWLVFSFEIKFTNFEMNDRFYQKFILPVNISKIIRLVNNKIKCLWSIIINALYVRWIFNLHLSGNI